MAGNSNGLLLGHLRTLYDAGTATGLTDGELLERFARRRDDGGELAFAALVERHGPMVLRACRGILRDSHDAMDAFQATFLVLARKSGSLWVNDSIAPWLHRVACRAAYQAKRSAARRRVIETEAAELARALNVGDVQGELESVIHEEVNRLPERYRSTVVLCDLEGQTCEQAAKELGCPVGTVGSRLSRGRQRLRESLRRRGLAPSAEPTIRGVLPPGLATSTAGLAIRFISTRTALKGAAATLSLEVLRAMSMNHVWKIVTILFAMCASTTGVVAIAGRDAAVPNPNPRSDEPPKTTVPIEPADDGFMVVKPDKFRVVIDDQGWVEATKKTDVASTVQARILSIVPEGTVVKKGDLVCELDPSEFQGRVHFSNNNMKGAEDALREAIHHREIAELTLRGYLEGTFPSERQAALTEIEQAQASVAKAEERLKRTEKARERILAMAAAQADSKTPSDVLAELDIVDRLEDAAQAVARRQQELDATQKKRDVLEKFTKEKTVKELGHEVEKANSAELVKQAVRDNTQAEVEKGKTLISECRILAPADGVVAYIRDSVLFMFNGSEGTVNSRGANVREGQKICSIVEPNSPMMVAQSVTTQMVNLIEPGLKARIKIDAIPDQTLSGTIQKITSAPNPSLRGRSGVPEATLSIENAPPGLRQNMTARVEIIVGELDKVLSVPTQATFALQNIDHLAIKQPSGGVELRQVIFGLQSGDKVQVTEGLKEGEKVALDPESMLNDDQMLKRTPGRFRVANSQLPPNPTLQAKLKGMSREDRLKLRGSDADREAVYKKAGLTDEEIQQRMRKQLPTRPRPSTSPTMQRMGR